MAYKILLPDNSYLKLPDNLSPSEGVDKAIEKFPELFYVDAAYKCGGRSEFTPILIDSGYACGYIAADKKSISLRKEVTASNGVFSSEVSMLSASLAAIFALFLFFALFKFFIKGSYKESRLKFSYLVLLFVSICLGIQSITNQLLLSYYAQIAIDKNFIWSSFLGTLIGVPVILTILYLCSVFVVNFKNKNKSIDSDFFLKAMNELDHGSRNDALWARCFAESDGDESKTKALYIKFRAADLAGGG